MTNYLNLAMSKFNICLRLSKPDNQYFDKTMLQELNRTMWLMIDVNIITPNGLIHLNIATLFNLFKILRSVPYFLTDYYYINRYRSRI